MPTSSTLLQFICTTQCNRERIHPEATDLLFVVSSWKPFPQVNDTISSLSLNIYSKLLEYAIGYECMQERSSEYTTKFVVEECYYDAIKHYCTEHKITTVTCMRSNEPYLQEHLEDVASKLEADGIVMTFTQNVQFLIDLETFAQKFAKPPIMETFYRWMRRESNLLMEDGEPEGGQWNYDQMNRGFDRKFVDVKHAELTPTQGWNKAVEHYAHELTEREERGHELTYHFPTTRDQAQQLMDYFITNLLDRFGELEDAMYSTSDFVYHSLVSTSLNFGLLTPQEVVSAVRRADTAINNKEGFIRQVIGRREYMFHRFNHYKDTINEENFFNNKTPLPYRFWKTDESPFADGTKLNCVQTVISRVDRLAYSHHIERLMVIGNFTLLMRFNPHSVNKRFREQYADAFEWVVTPNVVAMSQFADWGKLATKPYVSSWNYINKMSNYCKTCYYDPKQKYGEKACPFNALYWRFVHDNGDLFKKRGQSFMLNHLKKVDMEQIDERIELFEEEMNVT